MEPSRENYEIMRLLCRTIPHYTTLFLKFKIRKINIIDSSIWVLWKPIEFLDNIPKYRYICFHSCVVLWKTNTFLLSSFSNMIIDSESRWVGVRCVSEKVVLGRLVGGWWSVDLNKTQEKHILRSDFTCILWWKFILLC